MNQPAIQEATSRTDRFFTPLEVGGVTLPNRLAMSAMTREFAPGGVLDPRAARYYGRRAEGGIGLIITEGVAVNSIGARTARVPSFFGDAALAAWRPAVEAVHFGGGKILAQLWHAGLGRVRPKAHMPDQPSVGPSATYVDTEDGKTGLYGFEGGQALGEKDVEATIADFARAAANAQALGFDGIELHGGHGYLFDQFFWAKVNDRADRFGGDVTGRTRFAVEVVQAIRAVTTRPFIIALRFSQWKLPNLWDEMPLASPQELEQFLAPLVDCGIDLFDCSTRRYWDSAFEGSDLSLAGWTRKLSGKPTMTVGSVGLDGPLSGRAAAGFSSETASLDTLLDMFDAGQFDIVGIGRALLANPEWGNMVRDGRLDELVPLTREAMADLI